MATQFILIDRDTPYILPPCVQDYLPEEHMARFVVDIVDQLDLRALSAVYAGKGKRPYHPAMLLALLFYGYATGVFSSRKLEKATYDSMAFKLSVPTKIRITILSTAFASASAKKLKVCLSRY